MQNWVVGDEGAAESDLLFLRDRPAARLLGLRSIAWLVDIVHGDAADEAGRPRWQRYPAAQIRQLLGADLAFYEQLAAHLPVPG